MGLHDILVPTTIICIICFLYGITSSWDYESVKENSEHQLNQNETYLFYMCPLCDRLYSYYLLQTDDCRCVMVTI